MQTATTPPLSARRIQAINIRYDRNLLIHPNPDKKSQEEEILEEKIPDLLRILLNFLLEEKSLKPDSKEAIHAAYTLRQFSESALLRKAIPFCPDFIEVMCLMLNISEVIVRLNATPESSAMSTTQSILFGSYSSALNRCQQHALAILNNILLEVCSQ